MINALPISETEKDAGAAALSLIYLLNTFFWLQDVNGDGCRH